MSWEDRVQTPFQIITSTSTIIGKCTTTSIHGIIYMNSGNRFVDKKGINDACRVWYLWHQYSHYIKHVIYSVTITWQHYYPSIVTPLLPTGHVTITLEPLSRSEELQWKVAEMMTNMDLPVTRWVREWIVHFLLRRTRFEEHMLLQKRPERVWAVITWLPRCHHLFHLILGVNTTATRLDEHKYDKENDVLL